MNSIQLQKTKKLCSVAMLVAVAVLLGAFSIRVGSGIKISLKFLPVVLCSTLFGPLWGGLCGGISDFLSYLLNPAGGAYLFPISLVEFLYGVSYGVFFYKISKYSMSTILKVVVCLLINTIFLNVGAMAYILKGLLGMTFIQALIYRLPSVAVNFIIHFTGIMLILKNIDKLKKGL